ncbi:MAG: hypothetical protein PHF79_02390 [Candidatus Pacebacteria bacterium]|nr:hypothetical protein [Candidatus Paceibacterota bacterium]
MADPKAKGGKPKGKPAPESSGGPKGLEIVFWVILAGFILLTVVPFLLSQIFGTQTGTQAAPQIIGYDVSGQPIFSNPAATSTISAGLANFQSEVAHVFYSIVNTLHFLAIFFSFLFILGIFYTKFELSEVNRKKALQAKTEEVVSAVPFAEAADKPYLNERWQKVLDHSESVSPGDWRLAIIEADILLEEMLEHMGYQGESIGDKLKQINPSEFLTLNNAWEAHKVRNAIAHEGISFSLTKDVVRQTIQNYRKVFEEFYYI